MGELVNGALHAAVVSPLCSNLFNKRMESVEGREKGLSVQKGSYTSSCSLLSFSLRGCRHSSLGFPSLEKWYSQVKVL